MFFTLLRKSANRMGSSSTTARRYIFTSNERIEHNERNYMRKVLERTDGCILYEPLNDVRNIISPKTFSQKNAIVCNLEATVRKIYIYNRFNDISFTEKLLTPLNNQCVENYKSWPMNEQLYALDIWNFVKNVERYPVFEIMLSDFLRRLADLKNGPALQTIYYVAQSRRPLNATEQENSINVIHKNLRMNAATFDETSIYCLALFLNDVYNRNDSKNSEHHYDSRNSVNKLNLVKSLYTLLMDTDLRNQDEIAVSCVVKAVRRFSDYDHLPQTVALQTKLVSFAQKSSNMKSLTQIIHLGLQQRVFNEQLIDVILERFLSNLGALRTKEVERALLAISTFNRDKVENGIESRLCDEVQKNLLLSLDSEFPSSLIRCISYLVILGDVDNKLIEWALSPNTVSKSCGEENHLLLIDTHAKIDLNGKGYTGPTLPERFSTKADKDIVVEQQQSITANQIFETFKRIGEHCILARPFPYLHTPFVFLVYNKRTHRTMDCLEPNADGSILNPSDLNKMVRQNNTILEAIAVVPCSQRQTVHYTNRYIGSFQKQLDQLKMLGFKPIVIKQTFWKHYKTPAAKRRYLALELCRNNVFLLSQTILVVFKSKQNSKSKRIM